MLGCWSSSLAIFSQSICTTNQNSIWSSRPSARGNRPCISCTYSNRIFRSGPCPAVSEWSCTRRIDCTVRCCTCTNHCPGTGHRTSLPSHTVCILWKSCRISLCTTYLKRERVLILAPPWCTPRDPRLFVLGPCFWIGGLALSKCHSILRLSTIYWQGLWNIDIRRSLWSAESIVGTCILPLCLVRYYKRIFNWHHYQHLSSLHCTSSIGPCRSFARYAYHTDRI